MNKITLIEEFISYIGKYQAITEARLATLGGQGLEAHCWQEALIPPENGILVEKDQALAAHLRQSLPYPVYDSFGQAPWSIDACHLDLNGTLTTGYDLLATVLPAMNRLGACCLAVTVADERRNSSLENFDVIFQNLKQYVGLGIAKDCLKQLKVQQSSAQVSDMRLPPIITCRDPHKGALRELGDIVCLFRVLDDVPDCYLDDVRRYIYVSRFRGNSWRMRTYFFHLVFQGGSRGDNGASPHRYILDLWLRSAIYGIVHDQVVTLKQPITRPLPTKRKVTKGMTQQSSTLAKVVAAIGGQVLEEYQALVQQAQAGQQALQVVEQVTNLLQAGASNAATVAPPTHSSDSGSSQSTTVADPSLTEEQQKLNLQMIMLRGRASGKDNLALAYDQAHEYAGVDASEDPGFSRRLRALLACTQGARRPKFVYDMVQYQGKGVLKELAELYSQIEDQRISVNQLTKEAEI